MVRQGWYSLSETDVTPAGGSSSIHLDHGFAVMTQTCDLARGDLRPLIQIAEIVDVPEDKRSGYSQGRSPRFHEVLNEFFVDLDRVITVVRTDLAMLDELTPVSLNDEKEFREAVARKYGRLALPTHVDSGLKGLQKYLADRAKAPGSAGGQMVARLEDIRVSISPDWDEGSEKDVVEIYLIFHTGDQADMSVNEAREAQRDSELTKRITALESKTPRDALNSLAELLQAIEPASADDVLLWEAVAANLRRLILQSLGPDHSENGVVQDVLVSIYTKLGFNMDQYEDSERLDLAHLSGDDD